VQYAKQVGSYQPRNVGNGEVFGAELELRFNFGMLTEALRNLDITSNVTYTYSRIKMSEPEYDSRTDNAREGQTIDEYRDMAGQAPFIVNIGLNYNGGEKGFWNGLEAGVFYNVQGKTLEIVGITDRPDIYTNPFHSLNFNANKGFGEKRRFQVGLKIDNILNDKKESVFVSYKATDQYFTRLHTGTTFTLRLSYSLF
jgi:hypothetical protein